MKGDLGERFSRLRWCKGGRATYLLLGADADGSTLFLHMGTTRLPVGETAVLSCCSILFVGKWMEHEGFSDFGVHVFKKETIRCASAECLLF